MTAIEARKLIDEQDMENSVEIQKVYNIIKEYIKAVQPASGGKIELVRMGKLSPATQDHLRKQGYEVVCESDPRDGNFYRLKF